MKITEPSTERNMEGTKDVRLGVLPLVSIIIPCRNEEKFIGSCLNSVLTTDYPKQRLEVMVVDGMSDDRTRDVVEFYARTNHCVRLLDNPQRYTPFAVNIGIVGARGEIIMCMGAHARYPADYVSKCVAYLENYEADNVGGMMRTEPTADTMVAKSIAYVMSHRFGAGTATFRSGANHPKWVDTVFGGCYRRSVFEKIGYFNETLIKTQDREFNQRLRDAGGKILFAPDIQCSYYARGTLREFAKHLFQGGLWAFYGNRLGGRRFISPRNFVPLMFVCSIAVLAVTVPIVPSAGFLLATIVLSYTLSAIACALPFAAKERDARYLVIVPVLFSLAHIVYGIGSAIGIVKSLRISDEELCGARENS
jgi:succinoglycan biosynthesis protein ExoA